MLKLMTSIQAWYATRRDDRGATMVEYGLMVALIAVVAMGAVGILGDNVNETFTKIANKIKPGA